MYYIRTAVAVLAATGAYAKTLTTSNGTAGCGKSHKAGYNYHDSNGNFSIVSNGTTRYYSDYLVVYPQGYNRHWQGPSYAVKRINDLRFTTDLLAHIRDAYCIDNSRVYASGKSNGGGFVDLLACSDNGDEFAAFAMASAALYTDNSLDSCTKQRAILESHGDLDTTIPYHPDGEPGKGGDLPDIDEWVSWWGQRDCGPDAQAVNDTTPTGYRTTSYSCNGLQDVVKHYEVYDLGHCWPSSTGSNYDAQHLKSQHCADDTVLAYTPVVLDFFSRWTLENGPGKSGNASSY